jgi:50S ribosomal subunit-associated GTPase HflX
MDAVKDRSLVDVLRAKYSCSVSVSARDRIGLDPLGHMVSERLSGGFVEVLIEAVVGNGKLLAFLAEQTLIRESRYDESSAFLTCRVSPSLLSRLHSEPGILKIDLLSGASNVLSPPT